MIHPGTGQNIPAAFPDRHEGIDKSLTDRRHQLAQWLTAKQNPFFDQSLVNRYWSYFIGRGIIDPVNDICSSNPPTNPELLEALTSDFIENKFDLRHLIRMIVTSHTYQRSYRTNRWNEEDQVNYSHANPRRLAAEQLYDTIMMATGSPVSIPGVPPGSARHNFPIPRSTSASSTCSAGLRANRPANANAPAR